MGESRRTWLRLAAAGLLAMATVLAMGACGGDAAPPFRLATTTSTYDSGLLDVLLPEFEARAGVEVDVIAVGTGQALELGRRGDADLLLVHAPTAEQEFVESGHGARRVRVMFNDFVLVGPTDDPAGAGSAATASEALARIASSGSEFASRGDKSGTHMRETALWAAAKTEPGGDWYLSLGQGMGATLTVAHETGAYALTDRGTFLAQQERLTGLRVVFGGDSIATNPDPALRNPYSVMPLAPDRHPGAQHDLADAFVTWITSEPVQQRIATYGTDRFGQPLFYPDSEPWHASRGESR